jgi:methyl-accepting chemotaxis protein
MAFVARSIVKPITSITNAMQRLATGDTAVRLDYADRADEIGRKIEAIEIFRHNVLEIQAMQLARREAEEQRTHKRREEMAALAAEFEGRSSRSLLSSSKRSRQFATTPKPWPKWPKTR